MIPGAFAYHRPKSIKEAMSLLADLTPDEIAVSILAQIITVRRGDQRGTVKK